MRTAVFRVEFAWIDTWSGSAFRQRLNREGPAKHPERKKARHASSAWRAFARMSKAKCYSLAADL